MSNEQWLIKNSTKEEIEEHYLYMEAEKRMKNNKNDECTTQAELMAELGITQEELDSIDDDEIDID